MEEFLAFIPGQPGSQKGPLSRYLPPLPDGVASSWLSTHAPPGSWVLDPFGSSPQLILEAAQAGYRVLVAANNPIVRFVIEMASSTLNPDDMRSALADLSAARIGESRLEPHILDLYKTRCSQCSREVIAKAFLWEKKALQPFARIYECPSCGEGGEMPITTEDAEIVTRYRKTGLQRAWAIERITPKGDPDRHRAEEALEIYLPRPLYALFTMINKLDGLSLSPQKKQILYALLISAFDQANALWPHPGGRARPKQLTSPPQFRENNVWFALEGAISEWIAISQTTPLTYWPTQPPASGGISLFEGRLRDLVPSISEIEIKSVLTVLPRPNQAFWTLSALWAALLWGRDELGPFISVLRRRRYDWGWHANALNAVLSHLTTKLVEGTPIFSLITEAETGFLTAALIAAQAADLSLRGVSLRQRSGEAQILWEKQSHRDAQADIRRSAIDVAKEASHEYLKSRGEPAPYTYIHISALESLIKSAALQLPDDSLLDSFTETNNTLHRNVFTTWQGFTRYGSSEHSLEVGQWWLKSPDSDVLPLADRVETEFVQHLQNNPGCNWLEIDTAICAQFLGLLTPERELIHACLDSYGEQKPPGSGKWYCRGEDFPESRKGDLIEITKILTDIGKRLEFEVIVGNPLQWKNPSDQVIYTIYVSESAALGDIVANASADPSRCFIVLPGSRANLVMFKLQRNPQLKQYVDTGWRFLKFRHVRRLAESALLTNLTFDEQVALDPLTYTEPQIPLL